MGIPDEIQQPDPPRVPQRELEQTGSPVSGAVPDPAADSEDVFDYQDVMESESSSGNPISEEMDDEDTFDEVPLSDATIGDGRFARPGIGAALLWTLLLMVSQVFVGLGLLIVALVIIIAGGSIKGPLDPAQLSKKMESMVQDWILPTATLATLVISAGIALAVFRKQTARCLGLRGMTVEQAVLILLIALPMTVLTSEFTNCAAHLFPSMAGLELFSEFAKQSWPFVFTVACLFPGIGEEIYFRGFLSRGLIARHGVGWGTFFAAFLFGAMHVHPIQASGAFLLGLVLQFVFLTTRSLWGAILLHAANNALAFVAMKYGELLPIDGYTFSPDDGILHMSPWLVLVAVLTVGLLMWALHRSRTDWLRPDGSVWSPGFVTAQSPLPDTDAQRVSASGGFPSLAVVLVTYSAFLLMIVYSVRA